MAQLTPTHPTALTTTATDTKRELIDTGTICTG
jgi:hypothetical protein